MQFTKEQLIERCEEAISSLKPCSGSAEAKSLACFEIALASLTAKPFMYAIADPAGVAHMSEHCVNANASELWGEIAGDPDYGNDYEGFSVVPVYRLPELKS